MGEGKGRRGLISFLQKKIEITLCFTYLTFLGRAKMGKLRCLPAEVDTRVPKFIHRFEDPDHGRNFRDPSALLAVKRWFRRVGEGGSCSWCCEDCFRRGEASSSMSEVEGLRDDSCPSPPSAATAPRDNPEAEDGRINTILSSSLNRVSVLRWRFVRFAVRGRMILAYGSEGRREAVAVEKVLFEEDEEGLRFCCSVWNLDGMGFWRAMSNFTTRPALPTFSRRERIRLEKRETWSFPKKTSRNRSSAWLQRSEGK